LASRKGEGGPRSGGGEACDGEAPVEGEEAKGGAGDGLEWDPEEGREGRRGEGEVDGVEEGEKGEAGFVDVDRVGFVGEIEADCEGVEEDWRGRKGESMLGETSRPRYGFLDSGKGEAAALGEGEEGSEMGEGRRLTGSLKSGEDDRVEVS